MVLLTPGRKNLCLLFASDGRSSDMLYVGYAQQLKLSTRRCGVVSIRNPATEKCARSTKSGGSAKTATRFETPGVD
jgi:hypothetical protein